MSKASVQERRDYIKNKVNPILEVLVADLMKERPGNVIDYMGQWISKKGPKVQAELVSRKDKQIDGMDSSQSSDSSDSEYIPVKPNKKLQARVSVSGEAFGRFNKKEDFKPKFVQKNQGQIDRIKKRLGQSFMFSALDAQEQDIVVGAMEEVHFKSGNAVITQGDDGDVLYVVDQGQLDCHKKFTKDAQNTYLKTYLPGESFGELALLYNAPRAATITSKDNSICFSLDRACFNAIVKDAAMKKRERYDEFLQRVNILDSLDKYERGKICDCLQTVSYKKGDHVITEGESGNTFFFIQSGKAEALKKSSSGGENVVYRYEANDYFGELSLLRDEPRAASIRATADLVCAWIDRLSFKRLLGSLDTILERNTERYAKFMKDKGILN